jgi:hypothetical protein
LFRTCFWRPSFDERSAAIFPQPALKRFGNPRKNPARRGVSLKGIASTGVRPVRTGAALSNARGRRAPELRLAREQRAPKIAARSWDNIHNQRGKTSLNAVSRSGAFSAGMKTKGFLNNAAVWRAGTSFSSGTSGSADPPRWFESFPKTDPAVQRTRTSTDVRLIGGLGVFLHSPPQRTNHL